MNLSAVFLITFFSASVFGVTIEDLSRRVDAHLLIGDPISALSEARENIQNFPEEQLAHEMLLRSLAAKGEEGEMMQEWEMILQKFPNLVQERLLLEEMCLGILKEGCESGSLTTRLIAFLAIAKSQLPDAVALIKKGLNDTNAHLRSLNVELAAAFGDKPLQEELQELFRREKQLEVRKEILKAFAKLKLKDVVPELLQNLERRPKMAAAEKKATIVALASLREKITHDELKSLLASGRTWQVELACAMMRKWDLVEEAHLLFPFVENSPQEVRLEAIKTLGFLQSGEESSLEKACYDDNPLIGITASWALVFLDPSKMEETFSHWLQNEQAPIRYMAASALMMHGKKGLPLAKKTMEESHDPYVRANLALHFLKLRVNTAENAEILYAFLHDTKEKLMWIEESSFRYIHRSTLSHSSLIPNLPEAMNQKIRLEILNLLAIVEYKNAEAAIREFLKESRWELAGLAGEMLLQEGDESAVDLVRHLLTDPDKDLQAQAAFLLALWGRDPAALTCLTALYAEGDRALKIKILEALGFIGDESSIPFLVERLKEPSKTLRLVAACTLLETLYH